jgi:hypothetical protein
LLLAQVGLDGFEALARVFEGLQQFVRFGFLSSFQRMQVWNMHGCLLVDEEELYGHNGSD